jgi:nanoRNase/pAp phosphatase (c-di-AMP/oligoRNAs hydrolase)
MLSNFEGGGHRGAGSCRFHVSKAQDYIPKILDILLKNKDNED